MARQSRIAGWGLIGSIVSRGYSSLFGAEAAAPVPDERLTLSRSALVEGMVAEILEFLAGPSSGAPGLSEQEARWIVAGGIERAVGARPTN
jgi:hypothetical protein